jgi:hypothetical protein
VNPSPRRRRLTAAVVTGTLLWVLAIYPAYYVVHKPLSAAQFRAVANVIADLLTWLAMLAVATALGSRLTRRVPYHSLLEQIVFSAGLGLLCFALLTFGLGLVGALYRWLFWALLVAGGLLLWREFRALIRALRRLRWPRPRGTWPIFLSLFIAATLLLVFPLALTPPTNWDSLVHHLVGPERYLQVHRFTTEFDNYLLLSPALSEMLFMLGMGLKGDVLPRLLHFAYLLLILGALVAFAARYWQRRLGLLAVALFLSFPTAVQISTRAYVDSGLAFHTFAALYALLNWLSPETLHADPQQARGSSRGWLVLAGLNAGAAAGIKYNGLMSFVILGAVLAWALFRRRLSTRDFLLGGLVVGALALAVAAPWYIKNIVVTGNPIYPMAWGGRGWNEISARWLEPGGPQASLLDLVTLPWRLTVLGQQGTLAYDATFSPLFLVLLPLLLVVPRRAPALGALLLAAVVGYALWIISGWIATGGLFLNGRWLVPIFVPLSLLCAYSLDGMRVWDLENFSLRRVLQMLAGLTLGFGMLSQMLLTVGLNPWPYLVGLQSRDDYQDIYISLRYHQAITYLNDHLSDQDQVLFFWEPRSYGCQVPHRADPLQDNFSQYLARYGSPAEMVGGLRSEGFTHVLINDFVYPWIVRDFPITEDEQAAWEVLRADYFNDETLVHAEGEYQRIYRLPALAGP